MKGGPERRIRAMKSVIILHHENRDLRRDPLLLYDILNKNKILQPHSNGRLSKLCKDTSYLFFRTITRVNLNNIFYFICVE